MNTITIDVSQYRGAEIYAQAHNVSVRELVEKFLRGFKVPEKISDAETLDYEKALAFVKTLSAKDGRPVPAEERGIEALIDEKYTR